MLPACVGYHVSSLAVQRGLDHLVAWVLDWLVLVAEEGNAASFVLAWVKCLWGHFTLVVPPFRDRNPPVQKFVIGDWLGPIVARHS